MLVFLVLSQVKIVESIALGYLDNLTTFDTLTGKGQVPFAFNIFLLNKIHVNLSLIYFIPDESCCTPTFVTTAIQFSCHMSKLHWMIFLLTPHEHVGDHWFQCSACVSPMNRVKWPSLPTSLGCTLQLSGLSIKADVWNKKPQVQLPPGSDFQSHNGTIIMAE